MLDLIALVEKKSVPAFARRHADGVVEVTIAPGSWHGLSEHLIPANPLNRFGIGALLNPTRKFPFIMVMAF
jgi:hypothetical protein